MRGLPAAPDGIAEETAAQGVSPGAAKGDVRAWLWRALHGEPA